MDLVLLVADKNMQFAMKGVLERPEALGIRKVRHEFRVHPGRDGGARKTGPSVLALERLRFQHALLMFDFEGCGTDHSNALDLEADLNKTLQDVWGPRAKCIVIEPELDVWAWGSDNLLSQLIDWPGGKSIRDWVEEQGFTLDEHGKPSRPKEALEALLRVPGLPRSSSLYEEIASRISLRRCVDASFHRLRGSLSTWFGQPE